MSSRQEFEMSAEQYEQIIEACRPVPYIAIHCGEGPSMQERANHAWEVLGKEMGFEHMTVRPIFGRPRAFTAEARAEGGSDE